MIKPFTVSVPDPVLADLKARLARTRWPDSIGKAWDYGTDITFLRELIDYWQNHFDPVAAVKRLNQLDHFTTDIDQRALHFIHARSSHRDAQPLLMTHGWPGSIVEFQKILPMLTQPEHYGGDPSDAFHVICPSLPGYGFSDAPTEPGFDQKSAAIDHRILMERLGYERYFLQGGDWGSAVSSWHAKIAPERVAALHLTLIFVSKPKHLEDPFAQVSPDELEALSRSQARMIKGTGYQAIQGSKPQTLGYGLTDSPVGLAAWISEKFQHWTDPNVPFEQSISMDELLTNILLYWVSGNITASTRLYYESAHSNANLFEGGRILTPTGHAVFPGELYLPPRAWAEMLYNIQHWAIQPKGGHFAALEVPELLATDLRTFFRPYRVS